MPASRIVVEDHGVIRQLGKLSGATAAEMGATNRALAGGLAAAINSAARDAPAPQAHRFAGSARSETEGVGVVAVTVGGSPTEGGFPNGMAVLGGTEFGSDLERFHSPPGGRYWIGPTGDRYQDVVTPAAAARTAAAVCADANADRI